MIIMSALCCRVAMTWTPTMCSPAVFVLAAASRDSPCPPTTAVESAEPSRICPSRVNAKCQTYKNNPHVHKTQDLIHRLTSLCRTPSFLSPVQPGG